MAKQRKTIVTIAQFRDEQAKFIKPLGEVYLDSIHMTSGALTEILEFERALLANDKVNMIEELGDILFYLAGYTKVHGLKNLSILESIFNKTKGASVDSAGLEVTIRLLISLIDLDKSAMVYGKEYTEIDKTSMYMKICTVYDIIRNSIHQLGFTLEEVMTKNYEKLHYARYKDGYSDDSALNRDLDAERKILEN